ASASSPNSAASCVQATTTSASASDSWKAPASLRQSSRCTVTGLPVLSASPRRLPSSAMVPLQEHSLSVLLASDILEIRFLGLRLRGGLRFCGCLRLGRRLRFSDFFRLVEQQPLGRVERLQHLLRDR